MKEIKIPASKSKKEIFQKLQKYLTTNEEYRKKLESKFKKVTEECLSINYKKEMKKNFEEGNFETEKGHLVFKNPNKMVKTFRKIGEMFHINIQFFVDGMLEEKFLNTDNKHQTSFLFTTPNKLEVTNFSPIFDENIFDEEEEEEEEEKESLFENIDEDEPAQKKQKTENCKPFNFYKEKTEKEEEEENFLNFENVFSNDEEEKQKQKKEEEEHQRELDARFNIILKNLHDIPHEIPSTSATQSIKEEEEEEEEEEEKEEEEEEEKKAAKKEKKTGGKHQNKKRKQKEEQNQEEVVMMKGISPSKLKEYIGEKTYMELQTTRELLSENIPKINNSFEVVLSFINSLNKMVNTIPYTEDKTTGRIELQCGGCCLHCPPNHNLKKNAGRPPTKNQNKVSK